ncbi:MAG: hypothetical protein GWM90_20675 [Gemmatimonadetes bacterium]|nr:hypothetical protein [Gemmatimonadota bacterium]NIQ56905.1 hypothetical protein [Gemmatimonadota bacterium]NIU77079.1 hypothetical protein [Gammaproteobacteria bacterium]NIX46411.1 hypothetical protein [Gemmatimonadota bacterium]NIY10723.1 hypothetical protein [Gemmatimonadota bacterium]
MLADLFYQVGAVLGGLDAQLRGKGGAGAPEADREIAVYDADTGDVHDLGDDATDTAVDAAIGAASAWLLARLLRPRPISWPRAVLAGLAATLVADLVGRGLEDQDDPEHPPYAEDPDELMARFAAGVALAAGYAAILYPRLPGPPLVRGLAFGALEIAAAPHGGLVRMAGGARGVRFPLQALALPVDEDAGPLSHLGFGLALGLLYRYDPDPGDDD